MTANGAPPMQEEAERQLRLSRFIYPRTRVLV
jgi:hypothetical protein